jgi:hypothetical protein
LPERDVFVDASSTSAEDIISLPDGTPADQLQMTLLATTLNASIRDWMILSFERFAPAHFSYQSL